MYICILHDLRTIKLIILFTVEKRHRVENNYRTTVQKLMHIDDSAFFPPPRYYLNILWSLDIPLACCINKHLQLDVQNWICVALGIASGSRSGN